MKEIPVKGSDRPMLVDDTDYEWMSKVNWRVESKGYPRSGKAMAHHAVLGVEYDRLSRPKLPPGRVADHINRDKFDNRRQNLRWVTPSENGFNRGPKKGKKYKGIWKNYNSWTAQIEIKGQYKYLGTYKDPESAARAYDAEARKIPGAFLNFPDAA